MRRGDLAHLPTLEPPPGGTKLEPFDKDLLDVVRKAILMRNSLAHRGAELDVPRVKPTLLAIRDILWMLDRASGQEWAGDYIRESLDDEPAVGWLRV